MIGQRVRRREDPRFITGHGQYVDDLDLPGLLPITFVRSDWAHARIVSINASQAAALAVHNAVIDALSHLGIRHIDMPVNGEKVWRAITQATASPS